MELTGVVEYFRDNAKRRIQIIGTKEWLYLQSLESDVRRERTRVLFTDETPVIIFSKNFEIPQEMIELSEQTGLPLLRSEKETTVLFTAISNYLEDALSPIESVHGVLVDVNRIGVLIKGKSSIGKSETALELIQRGHRLVADDAVEIKKLDDSLLVGQAPELLRHFMEIRGIGIIDVKSLYGVGATKTSKMIDLIINLESWDDNKYYDRLGLDREYEQILGVNVEKLEVPVKPGRNTAMILEVAAMNFRQRGMGYDSAQEFTKKLSQLIDKK
jgi:HPr kinase/phosphorylase